MMYKKTSDWARKQHAQDNKTTSANRPPRQKERLANKSIRERLPRVLRPPAQILRIHRRHWGNRASSSLAETRLAAIMSRAERVLRLLKRKPAEQRGIFSIEITVLCGGGVSEGVSAVDHVQFERGGFASRAAAEEEQD